MVALTCPCCIGIQTIDATTVLVTANVIPSLDILQIPALKFLQVLTSTNYYPSNIIWNESLNALRTHSLGHRAYHTTGPIYIGTLRNSCTPKTIWIDDVYQQSCVIIIFDSCSKSTMYSNWKKWLLFLLYRARHQNTYNPEVLTFYPN